MRRAIVWSVAVALLLGTGGHVAAELSIKVVALTSPVSAGSDANIEIESAPGAECTIAVRYKSGFSRASGLYPKKADAKGRAAWAWRVGTRTTPGIWPIYITCMVGKESAKLRTEFMVR